MKHPLQRERERLGVSRDALAQKIGVTQDAVVKWERWSRMPRHAQRVKARAALDGFRREQKLPPLSAKITLFPHPASLPKGAAK